MSIRRSPEAARIIGLILVVVGGVSFGWFAWSFGRSVAEARRVTAIFDEGNRLYWNETIRCEANFEKRFGPLQRSGRTCYGDMLVTSRSPGAYPYTRIVVNDNGKAYLLFSPQTGMETTIGLGKEPLVVQLAQTSEGGLSGEGEVDFGRMQIRLRSAGLERCEATVTRGGSTSTIGLQRKELPRCDDPPNPPIHYLGTWGVIRPKTASPTTDRRLIQIWLWDASGARGLLLHDLAPSGMRRDFVFARQFRGAQSTPNRWDVRLVDDSDGRDGASLSIALSNGAVRISVPEEIVGPGSEAMLDPGAVVTDPRIELVPVRDRVLFESYLDNALFEINVLWTAP
jgi:hypothetical protein